MDFNNNEINILKNIIDARRDVRGNRFLDKKIKKLRSRVNMDIACNEDHKRKSINFCNY